MNIKTLILAGLLPWMGLTCVGASVTGCGEQSGAHTKISAGPFRLEDTKDEDVHLKGEYNPETKRVIIDDLTIKSNASQVNPTLATLVAANTAYQAQIGQNVIGGINAVGGIVGQVMPILSQRIAAQNQLAMAKVAQPNLIQEVVGAVAGGHASLPGVAPYLAPDELAAVKAQLAAIQAQLNALKATSQPSSP